MVADHGLNGLSLRSLARSVDMEPQSLYTYFASKHAVYDRLFAEGNVELLGRMKRLRLTHDVRQTLHDLALLFITFAAEDRARYELLFLRTIPDFDPSAESYAVAEEVFALGRSIFSSAGFEDDESFDLWTAIVTGLASQQFANDPTGDRYIRLIDGAVAMFVEHVSARSTREG